MTALPFVNHVLRLEEHATTNGREWSTSWHVEFDGTWSVTDADALAAAVDAVLVADLVPSLSPQSELNFLSATNLSNNTDVVGIRAQNHVGTGSGDATPNDNTVSVYYPAGTRYRGGHFHQFWTGFPATSKVTGANQWSTGLVNVVKTALDNVVAAINGFSGATLGDCILVGIHYFHLGAPLVTPTREPLDTTVVHSAIRPRGRRLGRS